MALVVRLARGGQKKRPFYRIVVAEKSFRRDGRFLEVVGSYNPMTNPSSVELNEDRLKYWIGVGAKTTDKVGDFLKSKLPNYLEELEGARRAKIQAKRKARKARAAAKA